MAIAHSGLTLEGFLQLPDEKPALEYLDGVVSQKLLPSGPHARLQAAIATWLTEAGNDGETISVFTDLHSHCPGRASLAPDVSAYLIDRVPMTPDGEVADDFWVPPDVAVEISLPGQSMNELTERANTLLELGVRLVLVIEPRQRRVRVARSGQPIVSFQGEDRVAFEDVLPGFAFVVRDLFGTPQFRRSRE